MNKYELAVVLTTKIEDEERAASIEKIKEVIARFGGVVTNVDEWGKKRLAYEIQKMKEGMNCDLADGKHRKDDFFGRGQVWHP